MLICKFNPSCDLDMEESPETLRHRSSPPGHRTKRTVSKISSTRIAPLDETPIFYNGVVWRRSNSRPGKWRQGFCVLRESGNLFMYDNQDMESLDSFRGCVSLRGAAIEILSETDLAKEDIRFRKHVLRLKIVKNSLNAEASTLFLSIENFEILSEWIGAFLVVVEEQDIPPTATASESSSRISLALSKGQIGSFREEIFEDTGSELDSNSEQSSLLHSNSIHSHNSEIYDQEDNYQADDDGHPILSSSQSLMISKQRALEPRRIPLHKTISGHSSVDQEKREYTIVVGSKSNGRIDVVNTLLGLDFFPQSDETILPLCISHKSGQKEPLLNLPSQLHMNLNMAIAILQRALQKEELKIDAELAWDPPLSRDCMQLVSKIRSSELTGFQAKEIGKIRVMETLKLASNLLKLIRHPKIVSSISSDEVSLLNGAPSTPTIIPDFSIALFSTISQPTHLPELLIEFRTPNIELFFENSTLPSSFRLRNLVNCPDPSDTPCPQAFSEMLSRLITWDVSTRVCYVTAPISWASRTERRLRKLLKTTVNRHDKSQRERVFLVLLSPDGIQAPIEDLQKSKFFPQHRVMHVCARMGQSAINMKSKGLHRCTRGSKWYLSFVREEWFRDFIKFAFSGPTPINADKETPLVEIDDELEKHIERLMDLSQIQLESCCTTVFKKSALSEMFSKLLM